MNVTPELIKACIKGNEQAHYKLFKACFPYMMSIAVRYVHCEQDAQSLVNEAFYKIVSNLKKFESEGSFKPWARRILVNTIINEFRKNEKHKSNLSYVDELSTVPIQDNQCHYWSKESDVKEILAMMRKLPEKEFTVLNLYAIEGYNHREISEMLEIPEGTSKWLLSNARNSMSEILKNHSLRAFASAI